MYFCHCASALSGRHKRTHTHRSVHRHTLRQLYTQMNSLDSWRTLSCCATLKICRLCVCARTLRGKLKRPQVACGRRQVAAARQAAAAAAAGSGRCQVALALSAAASQAVEFSSGCCRLRCVCMNWPPNAAGLSGPTIGQWTPVTNWSVWV